MTIVHPCIVAGTVPYAWPWDGRLDGRRVALLIVGADASWIGRACVTDPLLATLDRLASATRRAGGLVVHVHHDTAGARPVSSGDPIDGPIVHPDDQVVVAAGVDGFYGSALDRLLRGRGRDQLVVTGFGLEAPVHSTLRSANDQGYECLLVDDACAPLDPACRDAALAIVTMSGGIFGAIGSTRPLLDALESARRTTNETANETDPNQEVRP
jgi:nicotinamidase-related amidase